MKIKRTFIFHIFILALFIFSTLKSNSQNKKSFEYPATELLSSIEANEKVKFSYDASAFRNIQLQFSKKAPIKLALFLKAIEEQTSFTTKKTANNNYLIYKSTQPITICGTVINAITGQGISKIRVSDTDESVFTNLNGKFTLKTTASEIITFSGLGYLSLTRRVKKINEKECITVEIFEEIQELDEVVLISDYVTLGINKNDDGSLKVKPGDMKVIPGLVEPDVLKALQILPGINSPNGGASDLSIRGGNPDQNLILWDGIRLYDSGHFFEQISAFNPYITEVSKIYRSGTSTRYGQHTGGVVDIETISKIPETIKGGAGLNLINFDANLQVPLGKKIGFIFAGRKSENQIHETKFKRIKKKVFQNTNLDESVIDENITAFENNFDFYDLNAKLIWDMGPRSKLQISSLFMNNSLDFISEISELFKIKDTVYIENKGASIQWKTTTKKNTKHHFKAYISNYQYSFNRNEDFGIILNSKQSNSVLEIAGSYHSNFKLGKNIRSLIGYEFAHDNVVYQEESDEDDFFGIQNFKFDNKLNTHSFFSDILLDNEWLKFKGGIRANYITELQNTLLEPRMFFGLKLSDEIQLELSAEWKNQLIRQSYQTANSRLSSIKNAWVLTSEPKNNQAEIPNLQSLQYSIGASFSRNNFGITLETYLKKSDGLVTLNNRTKTINDDTYLIGKGTVLGVDLLAQKKIGKYRTWLGYSLSQNVLFFPEVQQEEFLNINDQTHVLNWSHTLEISDFSIGFSWNYRTGSLYSVPNQGIQENNGEPVLVYEELNNKRLPSFQTFNCSFMYTSKFSEKSNASFKIGIAIENIFNTENLFSREFTQNPLTSNQDPDFVFNDVAAYRFDKASLPFTPDFLLRIQF